MADPAEQTSTYQPPPTTGYPSYPTPPSGGQQPQHTPPMNYPQYPNYPPNYPPYPYPAPPSQGAHPPYPYPPYPNYPPTNTAQPPPQPQPQPVATQPPPTSAQSGPPPPDPISSFFNKMAHSIFVTKQKVLEITGQAKGSVDPELQAKIDKLKSIQEQYGRLETLSKQLLSNFKSFSESVKLIGDHFYESGVKEAGLLANPLRESGELHRALEKQSAEYITSLTKLVDVVSTFKGAAVEDTLLNLEKYTLARQDYDGAMLNLSDAKMGTTPSQDRIAECEILMQESKKLMEKLGEDLNTKVILLNEKRVQDLSTRLAEYVSSMQSYFVACNKIMEEHPITIKDDFTAEFKALMGDQL